MVISLKFKFISIKLRGFPLTVKITKSKREMEFKAFYFFSDRGYSFKFMIIKNINFNK